MRPVAKTPLGEDDLVRQALGSLFEIAGEDRPASVQASLREQIGELDTQECRQLVEQLVDTEALAEHVRHRDLEAAVPPGTDEERLAKVDEALEPLVAWTMGDEGIEALETMDEDERFHALFHSLGPS